MLLWLFKNDDSHSNPRMAPGVGGSRQLELFRFVLCQICSVPLLCFMVRAFQECSRRLFEACNVLFEAFSYLKGWGGRECLLLNLKWPSWKLCLDSWQLNPGAVLSTIVDTAYFVGLPWDWDLKGSHLLLHASNAPSFPCYCCIQKFQPLLEFQMFLEFSVFSAPNPTLLYLLWNFMGTRNCLLSRSNKLQTSVL